MNEKKAKMLRRLAEMVGPKTDQRLYRLHDNRMITLDPNCRRGIYRQLKREVLR